MPLTRLIDHTTDTPDISQLYTHFHFPEPPPDRPYLFVNMVATVDGRILLGEVGESAIGVGEATDQLLFRRLQRVADAAMLGGATVRASHVLYPPEKPRIVVTRTGNLSLSNRFFTDAPDRVYVLAPKDLEPKRRQEIEQSAQFLGIGTGEVDLVSAMRHIRQAMGIRYLLCEGGAVLNEQLLRLGLMDELFLTITPKLKGGTHIPGILEGGGLPRQQYVPVSLLSLYHDEDEFYYRYRVGHEVRQARP
jgi:riboflavin biosynthesis pyrimidine reductase